MKTPCMKAKIPGFILFCASVLAAYLLGTWHTDSRIDQVLQDKLAGKTFMQGSVDVKRELERMEDKIIALQVNTGKPIDQQPASEVSLTVALLKQMNSLERRLDALDSQYSNGSQQAVSQNNQIDNTAPPPDNPTEQASFQARMDQIRDNLETRLSSEPVDPVWSSEVKNSIQTTLQNLQQNFHSQSALIDVDCKSSLCRVEMSHGKNDDRTLLELDMQTALAKQVGESTTQEIRDNNGNVQRTVYYFARRGKSILREE